MTYDRKEFIVLQDLLISLNEVMWRAQFMARRMTRSFGENAYLVFGAFLAAGWSFDDIYQLDQVSNQWRNAPHRVLLLEKLLRAIGLPELHARRLAMESRLYACRDYGEILHKVLIFRHLGLSDNELFRIAGYKPSIFLTPVDGIDTWLVETRLKKREPRFCVQYLKPPKSETKLAPEPVPEYWKEFDIRFHVPANPPIAANAPSPDQEVHGDPNRVRDADVPIETASAPSASVEKVISEQVPATAVPEAVESQPAPLPDETELATPMPVQVDESAQEPIAPPPALAPTPSPRVLASPIVEPKIPKLQPLKTFTPPAPAPAPVSRPPPPVVQPVVARIVPAKTEEEQGGYDMISELYNLVMETLKLHDPDWFEKNRQAFVEANPWLNDTSSSTWEIIRILKSWFDLRVSMAQTDPRLDFVVCILRNQNLPAKKRLGKLRIKRAVLKRRDDPFTKDEIKALDRTIANLHDLLDPRERVSACESRIDELERRIKNDADGTDTKRKIAHLRTRIAKAERYGNLHSFLELEPEIAYLRLYMARSILDYDKLKLKSGFLVHPEFLLHPFEDAIYGGDQGMRGFSIAPPTTLDMKTIQAKCTELRYRVNELRRYTDQPWKKPYVNMLCEPARTRFLERLQKHLRRLGEKAKRPNAARHRHRGRTAYSPLG
ncbi:hypothetical protein HZC53_05980 [Candidatus Uhrbacteria bacterium]|nr:hypothetical protein [Candidatus Uhrbacteria bacterium]